MVDEHTWRERVHRYFHTSDHNQKPTPLKWRHYFFSLVPFSLSRGRNFRDRVLINIRESLAETLTPLQELVLSRDLESTREYLSQQSRRSEKTFDLRTHNSALHYAGIIGQLEMVDLLLEKGSDINQPDFINGFTLVHYAFFTENRDLIDFLLAREADFDKKDAYFGLSFDYAIMMDLLPQPVQANTEKIGCYLKESGEIESWSIKRFEKEFGVTYSPMIRCGQDYLEELMFSGLSLDPDIEFREKMWIIAHKTGDEDVVLAFINEEVGYGVYAAKDYQPGEFVIRYGGYLRKSEDIKDSTFNMRSGLEGIGLDASLYRNLGGMINHSVHPNVECQCFFDCGAEQALVTSIGFIERGTQLLLDYSNLYWDEEADTKEETQETKTKTQGRITELWREEKVFPYYLQF